GSFDLVDVEAGEFQLTVTSRRGFSRPLKLELEPGGRIEGLEIRLTPGVTVSGRVLDTASRPVAGAVVQAATWTTQSDTEGRFTLDGVPPENPLLLKARLDERRASRQVDVPATGLDGIELVLAGQRVLRGQVVDPDGQPISSVRVVVPAGMGGEVFTDIEGRFRLPLPSQAPMVVTERAGYASASWPLADDETDVLWTLRPELVVRGRILGLRGGQVLIGASSLSAGLAGVQALGIVQPGGEFEIGGLGPGAWQVFANADGVSRFASVELVAGAEPPFLEIDLATGFEVVGVVRIDGEPAAGSRVMLSRVSAAPGHATATTDANGRFVAEVEEEGLYQVVVIGAAATGGPSAIAPLADRVEIVEGRPLEFDWRSNRVVGRLQNANGAPVTGTVLLLAGDVPAPLGGAPVTSDGSFVLTTVRSGPARLRVLETTLGASPRALTEPILEREITLPSDGGTLDLGTVVVGASVEEPPPAQDQEEIR
ncbi:MAG: carboxypeptidase regulatory-like domain-containing protein, partial [Acidobacteriota bacterium]